VSAWCQELGGCDQPAAGCEPHHVLHRRDGGHTSLANLKDYCSLVHHHVVLHQRGWKLTAHPDGTSHVTSPSGRIIRSHSPPLLGVPPPGNQPARTNGLPPSSPTTWATAGGKSGGVPPDRMAENTTGSRIRSGDRGSACRLCKNRGSACLL
jgi:hypothetical protein